VNREEKEKKRQEKPEKRPRKEKRRSSAGGVARYWLGEFTPRLRYAVSGLTGPRSPETGGLSQIFPNNFIGKRVRRKFNDGEFYTCDIYGYV